jgi:hypothetical protein
MTRSVKTAKAKALTLGLAVLAAPACKKASTAPPTPASQQATEWVNFQAEVPLIPSDFDPLASSMFGANAQAGQYLTQHNIGGSFYISSAPDPTTPSQVRLTFSYVDGSGGAPRTLAMTPVTYATAQVFIETVDAALAKAQADLAQSPTNTEAFDIEYQATSSQGGSLSFGVKSADGVYPFSLSLSVTSPHTSLTVGHIGQAATYATPYEDVAGTVWFGLSKDDFDYFVGHAYGSEAEGNQNFSNFELDPFDWLRLTVTPQISKDFVDVSFDVVALNGSRVHVANAPASIYAGNTFQTLVDQMMSNMSAQEAAKPGSSTPWQIPFFYDQPEGGGVVQVIAQGSQGNFQIAYSISSPQSPLVDVPFVPYKNVTITPPSAAATETCSQMGYQPAEEGVFQMTFTASQVIQNDLPSGTTLTGDIGCSIFYGSDVTVSGPIAGATSLQDFTVHNANLLSTPPPSFTSGTLKDGTYQILCAQYVNGSSTSMKGDPVTLPIGGFTIACNTNPVTVQFAILDPDN